MGDLQSLPLPDPLDPFVVDDPARLLEQTGDLAIAVAAILPGQGDEVGGQSFFVGTAPRHLALRRAVLPERRASTALGYRRCYFTRVTGTSTRCNTCVATEPTNSPRI